MHHRCIHLRIHLPQVDNISSISLGVFIRSRFAGDFVTTAAFLYIHILLSTVPVYRIRSLFLQTYSAYLPRSNILASPSFCMSMITSYLGGMNPADRCQWWVCIQWLQMNRWTLYCHHLNSDLVHTHREYAWNYLLVTGMHPCQSHAGVQKVAGTEEEERGAG